MDFAKDLFLSIPREKLDVKKFTYIILKKLKLGHIIKNITLGNYYIDFLFCNKDVEYDYYPIDDRVKRYNLSTILQTTFYDNTPDSSESVFFKLDVFNSDINPKLIMNFKFSNNSNLVDDKFSKYNNYLFINEYFSLSYTLNKTFGIKHNTNERAFVIDDPYLDQKINSLTKSFIFYSEQQNDFIPFIHNLSTQIKTETNTNTELSLSMCSKFSSILSKFDKTINLPLQKNVNYVIDYLNDIKYILKMNKLKDFKLQGGFYTIGINSSSKIQIYLNSFLMLSEDAINKFKYLFHPGLYFFVKYLEDSNNIETVKLNIQKVLFKNV